MKQADLFVQTSLFESYGLSLAEAMILGIPIVSTRTDGAIELTKNGELGLLCDINSDSITKELTSLLISPNKLSDLKNAVETVDFEEQNQKSLYALYRIL